MLKWGFLWSTMMMNVSTPWEEKTAYHTNSVHCYLREFDKCSPAHSRLPTHYLSQIIHPSRPHSRLFFFTRRFQKPRDDLEFFGAGEGLDYHNTTMSAGRVRHVKPTLFLHNGYNTSNGGVKRFWWIKKQSALVELTSRLKW